MSNTIILQRVLTHYRAPLFQALHEKFGWHVVIASNPPRGTFLDLKTDLPDYIHPIPFVFLETGKFYRCDVPTERIINELKPRRIISEFAMNMNVWRDLARQRFSGKIESYALWSHGWNMERGFGSMKEIAMQYGRLPPMALADMLLTYTNEGANWLKRWMPWKTTLAIGNMLDTDSIRRETEHVVGERSGKPQFLAVGRLTPDKNMPLLLDIFSRVQQDLPSAALTIIGDGPERARLERAIDVKGLRNVTMVGALYQEGELARHFKGADAFLMPGAAGLSVNHALAYHLPIIAYGRGRGLPLHHPEIEYVVPGETGILCNVSGEEAFAATVVRAWNNGEIERLHERIPGYVDRHMRLEHMMNRFGIVDALL